MPSSDGTRVTRRDVLRASSILGIVSLAGCAEQELASSTPVGDSWPLTHYDPRNTARSPNASPPRDPSVDRFPTTREATSLVVGGTGQTRRILVGGYNGLTAHHRDGSIAWRGHEANAVAIRPHSRICYEANSQHRVVS